MSYHYLSRAKYHLKLMFNISENRRCKKLASTYDIGHGFKRIYLYHIKKTGGKSLSHIFFSLGLEKSTDIWKPRTILNDKIFVRNKRLIEQGYYFYGASHLPAHKLNLLPKTFTITCLRDPAQRVISLYKMLIEDELRNFGSDRGFWVKRTRRKWLGSSFTDFLDNLPKEMLLHQLYMFSSTFEVDEAFYHITNCSHFFFLEDFNVGLVKLSAKLGFCLKPEHHGKTSIKPDIRATEMERLRSMLEPEYQLVSKLKKYLEAA